jgi:serine/tyrosine/threonine adenylyltransferase
MQNWNQNSLPILQLGSDFYDEVKAAELPELKLRYKNKQLNFGFDLQHFALFNSLPNNLLHPLALRYHGHQFQHYNPDLGDGRGFLFGQIQHNNQWYDFGTKGSGQTPYSRAGDGRLTLKGAFREALATEMLESLGVTTSKTFCFFETGEKLERNDEPSPTRAAVLTRFSKGHIRIGTFQRLAYFNQTENIKKLISYCLNFYFADVLKDNDQKNELQMAELFLETSIKRNAQVVAELMMAGFVHGVLNTDNINVVGELFDYGPYRFLPNYDPHFTAAYFDHQKLYCYGRQPASFIWALNQLVTSVKLAYPSIDPDKILENFSTHFNEAVQNSFLKRLNLKSKSKEENSELLAVFFQMIHNSEVLFEQSLFDFNSLKALQKTTLLEKYPKEQRTVLLSKINSFEVNSSELANDTYFQNDNPETLIIDEIEALWKPISDQNNWEGFYKKIERIQKIRHLYK